MICFFFSIALTGWTDLRLHGALVALGSVKGEGNDVMIRATKICDESVILDY